MLARCAKHFVDLEADPDDPRGPYFEWVLKQETDSEPFADLDDRFFKLYFADKTEFRRKLFQYIATHESEFLTPDS